MANTGSLGLVSVSGTKKSVKFSINQTAQPVSPNQYFSSASTQVMKLPRYPSS